MEWRISRFEESLYNYILNKQTIDFIVNNAIKAFTNFELEYPADSGLRIFWKDYWHCFPPSPLPPPPAENWQRQWRIAAIPAGATRFYIWTNRMPGRIFRLRGYERRITITVSNNPIAPPAVGDTVQFDVKKRVNDFWYYFNNTNSTKLPLPAAMYATGGYMRVTLNR